jgi:hypothetical protein
MTTAEADSMTLGHEIDGSQWEIELDHLSYHHQGDYVTIEVLDRELGHQLAVARLPFDYLAYDSKADTVLIAAGGTTSRSRRTTPPGEQARNNPGRRRRATTGSTHHRRR